MATSLAQQAETWRCLLYFGLASVSDVVRWADEQFKALDDYNDDLANVCPAVKANPTQMDRLLQPLAAGADPFDALRETLGVMYRAVVLNNLLARDFAKRLYSFYCWCPDQVPKDLLFLAIVDEEFDQADARYVSKEYAMSTFIQYLTPFDRGS